MSNVYGNPRWLPLDGAVNARIVAPGALLRSDNLQSLSARDRRLLIEEQALEVVIDLRTEIEVQRDGPGPMTGEPAVRLEHHSLYPESGGNTDFDAAAVKPRELPDDDDLAKETPVVRAYVGYLRRRPDSVVASSRAIARARGAVLVHCAAGKDRTGVVVAVALDAAEIDRDAIVDDYMATGERIGAIVARLVRSPTYRSELERYDPQQHAPVPGTMERFLELVDERFGGAAAWLSANGLGSPDLERLRSRLASSARAGRGQSPRPPRGAGCS